MYKIGIIGDKQSVLGFKAVGLDVFDCTNEDEAKSILKKIAKEDYAVIYITEGMCRGIMNEINEYNSMRLPAIVPVPGMDGGFGIGISRIKKAVEKAVGADILFDNN